MASLPTLGLGRIESIPLHEQVYQRLTHALMAGQIRPGQKLTSRKLAAELGTSDMPVRAALLRLQSLRALDPLPNGSLTLPPMTRERFADLVATRLVCEPAAVQSASPRLRKTDLRLLRKDGSALNEAARQRDIDAYLLRNHAFKFRIYAASGSPSLLFLIETLWLQVGPYLRQFSASFDGNLEGILDIDFHEDAIAAFERGDPVAAAAAIHQDIAEGARYLLERGAFD